MSTRRFYQSLLREATARLQAIGAGNPRLESEHLLVAALGIDRHRFLSLGDRDPIDTQAMERFEALLLRRLAREPLQYILGTVPFCDLDLEVGPGVLIPRSETEVLVERVVERISSRRGELCIRPPADSHEPLPWVVDVGTGSGAILLALLSRLPACWGLGIDISARALEIAERNRGRIGEPGRRATFVRGDLLSPVRPAWSGPSRGPRAAGGPILAIVSNPPYIRSDELGDLAREIREHEPMVALDGGADGLAFARPIWEQAAALMSPGGLLALELAPDQPERVAAELARSRLFEPLEVFHDLARRPRGILAVRV